MTAANLTEIDIRVRDAVMRQLDWDPEVDTSAVGVAAKDGTVTLTGFIDSYFGKLAAERAAKRVRGVRAVANEIDVRLKLARTDVDIAQDAATALKLRGTIPEGVQAVVHNSYVTLTGTVNWLIQKQDAEKTVRRIRGVRNVLNHIVVVPQNAVRDIRGRIVKALHQNADLDARRISVTVTGETATLTGTVGSWLQRDVAAHAAAAAPGICQVRNEIQIEPAADASHGEIDELC